jgi:hypothetical protein
VLELRPLVVAALLEQPGDSFELVGIGHGRSPAAILADRHGLVKPGPACVAPPPSEIVLATGQPGGVYDSFGREYQKRLHAQGLRVELVLTVAQAVHSPGSLIDPPLQQQRDVYRRRLHVSLILDEALERLNWMEAGAAR